MWPVFWQLVACSSQLKISSMLSPPPPPPRPPPPWRGPQLRVHTQGAVGERAEQQVSALRDTSRASCWADAHNTLLHALTALASSQRHANPLHPSLLQQQQRQQLSHNTRQCTSQSEAADRPSGPMRAAEGSCLTSAMQPSTPESTSMLHPWAVWFQRAWSFQHESAAVLVRTQMTRGAPPAKAASLSPPFGDHGNRAYMA